MRGRRGFLNPTLRCISRLSVSHHLLCKVVPSTDSAARTAVTGLSMPSAKPGFLSRSHLKGRLQKPPQGRCTQMESSDG